VGAAVTAALLLVVVVVSGVTTDDVERGSVDVGGPAADVPAADGVPPATGVSPGADTFALAPTTDTGERPSCVSDADCLVWTVEHPGRGPVWRDVSVDGDLLVLTDRLGTTALDVEDGTTRWRIEADPTAQTGARGHAVSDSLVVLIERDGVLRGYDRATGELRWISPLPAALRVRHAVDHGEVVVVVADAVAGAAGAVPLLAGFDRSTGERRWLRRATSAASTSGGPVVFDGPRRLRGLDPATGLVRWETEVEGPLGSVVGVGGTAVYVGWEQTVVADAVDGDTVATAGPPPALVPARHAGSIVLLGEDRVELVTTAGSRWSVPAPSDTCCATVLDGDVVVVATDGGRTVLAGDDGAVVERREGRGDGVFLGPAWLVGADADRRPGRQSEATPDIVPMRVFDARGGRGVAATPPGIAVAGVADGVVIAGAGWVSRIRTD
jgi:outer membrane protein assembly factor BamB